MMGNELAVTTGGAVVESRINFDELKSRFLSNIDVGAQSRKTYDNGITKFINWINGRGNKPLQRADIIAYRDDLKAGVNAKGRANTPATVATYMAAVKSFYTFLETNEGIINLARGIKVETTKEHKKDALTTAQAAAVLNSIDRGTVVGRRDFALMKLLITTGLRTVEATRANVEDIRNRGDRTVLYVHGKGRAGKDEFVYLSGDVERAIRTYLKDRRNPTGDAPLFASHSDRHPGGRMLPLSISRIVKTRLQAAGYDDSRLTAHSLRHTAVTWALEDGASVQEAQAMARHRSINTTLIYAHNIDRDKNAAELRVAARLAAVA